MFLAALQFLQARDNFPHIRAGGQCRTAVMSWSPEDDSRVVVYRNVALMRYSVLVGRHPCSNRTGVCLPLLKATGLAPSVALRLNRRALYAA